jgi:poly(3-hydroxybutyrate) depolymerase
MTRRLPAGLIVFACVRALAAEPLPALGADTREVTVSGVSSGAYMAVQFHVAHSNVVKGVAAIAGGPYYCARGSVWAAVYNCMTPAAWTPLPQIASLKSQVESLARAGRIDPTANLGTARVWLFSGRNDRTVVPEVVHALARFYAASGLPPSNLVLVSDKPAGHAMITENGGNTCEATAPPYINDCDYDAAGELLKHLLGTLKPPAAKESGRIVAFDQNPQAAGDAFANSLAETGYLYLPQDCASGGCRVHVAFHGCRQGADEIGERFVREAGYNRWADANRLIVLYPQAAARSGWGARGWTFVFNPRGCWDWWGYTGPDYHTKSGPQIRAVKAMLERLAQSPG